MWRSSSTRHWWREDNQGRRYSRCRDSWWRDCVGHYALLETCKVIHHIGLWLLRLIAKMWGRLRQGYMMIVGFRMHGRHHRPRRWYLVKWKWIGTAGEDQKTYQWMWALLQSWENSWNGSYFDKSACPLNFANPRYKSQWHRRRRCGHLTCQGE